MRQLRGEWEPRFAYGFCWLGRRKHSKQLNNQSTNQKKKQQPIQGRYITSGACKSQFRVILRVNSIKKSQQRVLSVCASTTGMMCTNGKGTGRYVVFVVKEIKKIRTKEQLNNQPKNPRLNQPTHAGDWVIASGARESQFRVIFRTNSAKTRISWKGVLSICASNIAGLDSRMYAQIG